MRYQKPEILRLAAAIEAVQNPQNKTIEQVLDDTQLASAHAYSADE